MNQLIKTLLQTKAPELQSGMKDLKKGLYEIVIQKFGREAPDLSEKLINIDKAILNLSSSIEAIQNTLFPPSIIKDSVSSASFKRKWKRKQITGTLIINDFSTGIVHSCKLISLSAGGCLVSGVSLPQEFQFTLEINNGKKRFNGLGTRLYRQGESKVGIFFKELSSKDQSRLNEEILASPAPSI